MTINQTKQWFEQAIPHPTKQNQRTQVGVHAEEFREMLDTLTETSTETVAYYDLIDDANRSVEYLAESLKKDPLFELAIKDRAELLDSLCDQIVTATGIAHNFGFDIIGALGEVNRSNFSKFVDGKPVFNEHGKIAKGNFYTPPNLTPFLGNDPTLSPK